MKINKNRDALLREQAKQIFKSITDASTKVGARYVDDAGGMFAAELVKTTLKRVFEIKYPNLVWASGDLLSMDTSADEYAESIDWYELDSKGEAEFYDDPRETPPRAEIHLNQYNARVHNLWISTDWTDEEMGRASMQNLFSLADKKASAARRGFDQKLNRLVLHGDQARKMYGMKAIPGSYDVVVATGGWGTSASPEQIKADFRQGWDTIFEGSKGMEMADTAVFPSSVWSRISDLQNSVASESTVLDYLKKSYPTINKWIPDYQLNTAGRADGPCVLLYDRSPEVVTGMMPMGFRPMRLKEEPDYVEQRYKARYAGIKADRPRAIARLNGV